MKEERSRANTFLVLGNPATIILMSILSGYLIDAVGWRWMFILEGFPSIVWAFCWWWLVDDHPAEAKWLSADEKKQLAFSLQKEQELIKPVKNFGAAFRSRTVILLCVQFALWSIGAYGFIMWLPSIIKAAPQMSIVKTGWLSACPYLFAIAGMFTASYFSDKFLNRKSFIWPFLLVGALAFYFSWLAGAENFRLSFALLVVAGMAMYTPYGPFFAMITEILPRNVNAGAIALINSSGALGSFVGSYIVGYLNGATKSFSASYLFMAASLLISAVLTVVAVKEQKRIRAKQLAELV